MLLLAGAGLGGLLSWLVTYVYYVKANRQSSVIAAEHKALLQKLPAEFLDALHADKRAALTVLELNELLRERTIDGTSTDIFPYKACPQCGSDNIYDTKDVFGEHDGDDWIPVWYRVKKCEECGWQTDELTARGFR